MFSFNNIECGSPQHDRLIDRIMKMHAKGWQVEYAEFFGRRVPINFSDGRPRPAIVHTEYDMVEHHHPVRVAILSSNEMGVKRYCRGRASPPTPPSTDPDRIETAKMALLGTCSPLDEIAELHEVDADALLGALSEGSPQIDCCTSCGWWFETCDLSGDHDLTCFDCSNEQDEDTERD